MGLAWELHELIQDFVDGKLSAEREAEVQTFLDQHPTAQKVADQYRLVTQPDFTVEPDSERKPVSDSLVDRVMAAIDSEPWYSLMAKHGFLTSFAVVSIFLAVWYLGDLGAISNWVQVKLVPNIGSLGLIDKSVVTVLERLNGLAPVVGASILIAAFYGTLDRLMAPSHKTKNA